MNQKQIFRQLYDNLNPGQQRAVDAIEGPVMVIAGPGTGKTQILGARIGRILLETDTDPSGILCLTYTDAGAIAMRRRLLSFIGPEAYRVNIYTFHAFCHDIIQENLSLFEKNKLDPVSELELLSLFRQLIDSFPKNHPLKRYRGDVYYEIRNLRSLFSTMKREGFTPAFLEEKIKEYLTDIPGRDEFIYKKSGNGYKKGELKKAKLEEHQEKMEKTLAGVREFDRFQSMLKAKDRYDFDDMINWVIRAFTEQESLLRRYQEKYLYILVDEFQDTSGSQNNLLSLLLNHYDRPNVFVVGDDDQSIFRFQGASFNNMLEFADFYKKDLLTIVLTDNYRSTQPILDLSKKLISNNDERLVNKLPDLTKDLVASNLRIKNHILLPQIREYETEKAEMADIVSQVESLISKGTDPGRIGVIYRENRYGEDLLSYFKLRNIPVYSKRNINLLEDPVVTRILLIVRYLSSEMDLPFSGDEMLFEILHAEWFHIPPVEIAALSAEVAHKQYGERKTSLRQLIQEKSKAPARDLFSQAIDPRLLFASNCMESLIGAVSNVTLQSLFEKIFSETGLLLWAMQHPDKRRILEVLTAFFDFIKDETRRNPSMNLRELVLQLDLMEENNITLPLVQVNGSADAVNLLTAHGSKGLEFSHVFFAGCNSHYWEKKQKTGSGFLFPDTIYTTVTNDYEEMRRLFYVVLTRAETHLYVSFCRFRDNGKDAEPSVFIEELRADSELTVERMSLSEKSVNDFRYLLLRGERPPEIERVEADFVHRALETFQMNVTALNNYLKCPLEFYFRNLVRIPSPKNENTEFGSAVHYALEQLFRNMQDNNNQFAPLSFFLNAFDWYLVRHRESFTREQFNRRMEYGHIVLPDYYNKYLGSWNRIVSIERNIRNVVIGDVPVKGKLDKLEFDGKQVNVVDYKTGDPGKAKAKMERPSEKNPLGGDYWRQAVFYKLLVDRSQRDWQVVSTEFDFIEPDNRKNYSRHKLFIQPEDDAAVIQQITDVWGKIRNHDFYTGCGKEDCHWCRFVKTNQLDVNAVVAEEEEDHASL